jgi:hypothetical protein
MHQNVDVNLQHFAIMPDDEFLYVHLGTCTVIVSPLLHKLRVLLFRQVRFLSA